MSASKPLKVCLVTPLPPPYGGIGNWGVMIRRFAEQDPGLRLCFVDVSPRWRAIDDMVVWKRVVIGGATMFNHVAQVLWHLLCGYRVIHIATPGQLSVFRDITIIAAAKLFRARVLYHIRFGRVPEIAAADTFEWRRISRAMRMAHKTIAIDLSTADAIRRYLPDVDVVHLPNCVDFAELPHPEPADNARRTVLFLGMILPTKGVSELVQAWSELKHNGWQLEIVGMGGDRYQKELLERFRPVNLRFLGEKGHDEAMRMMANAEVFVLPTYTEGFPNVIVEAMALGRPIVSTSVGAIPEMLADGCGVLVPPGEVAPLRRALEVVMRDRDSRRMMGERARAKAQRMYALTAVFERLRQLWHEASQ